MSVGKIFQICSIVLSKCLKKKSKGAILWRVSDFSVLVLSKLINKLLTWNRRNAIGAKTETHIIARVLSQQKHQKDKVNRELVNRDTNDQ